MTEEEEMRTLIKKGWEDCMKYFEGGPTNGELLAKWMKEEREKEMHLNFMLSKIMKDIRSYYENGEHEINMKRL